MNYFSFARLVGEVTKRLSLLVMMVFLLIGIAIFTQSGEIYEQRAVLPNSLKHAHALEDITFNPYLELSLDSPIVTTDTLITLYVRYHNLGLPYTSIVITPPNLVEFEPFLSMPCEYGQHPNGCTAITLRTLAPGVVTFRANATGEAYDETCNCWYWTNVEDNGPAILIIGDTIWETFLPWIQR